MNKRGGRTAQKTGKTGQDIARRVLESRGFTQLHEVATPVITRRTPQGSLIVGYREPVPCDFIGLDHERVAAMVEVKLHNGDRLQHSRLQPHQVMALTGWDNAVPFGPERRAYVIWIRTDKGDDLHRIRRYPGDRSWRKGTSWKWGEQAKRGIQ
jgi:hypothetical protein